MEITNQDSESALEEFIAHRIGREIEGVQYAEADKKYFAELVRGVVERQSEVDRALARLIAKGWSYDRVDPTMRAIMRAAALEIIARADVPVRVVVNEYLKVAAAFYGEGDETAFLSGVLNRLARERRPEDHAPAAPSEQ